MFVGFELRAGRLRAIAPNAAGSMVRQVSQQFERPYAASGMNSSPGSSDRAADSVVVDRAPARELAGSDRSWPRPIAASRLLRR